MNTVKWWRQHIDYTRILLDAAQHRLGQVEHHEIQSICRDLDALRARLQAFGDGLELAEAIP